MSQRPLPSLNALRAFEAAARLGSVGAAAQELHVTHGAVSRQIRLLEDELGLPLFRRDGRGVRTTAAGERLGLAAGEAFDRLQAAVADIRRPPRPAALVLGCPGSLLARWMIPRLEILHRDLPGLTLHLSAREGDFAADLDGLDAALLIGHAPWPATWRVRTLAGERIGPVMHPALAASAGITGTASLQRLRAAPLLHTTSRPQAWPSWAAAHGLDPAALRYGTGFEHLYYLLEAAVAGLGIAIAPEPLVADDLASGRLIAPWGFSATGGDWALCTRVDADDPRTDALAAWLHEQLGGSVSASTATDAAPTQAAPGPLAAPSNEVS